MSTPERVDPRDTEGIAAWYDVFRAAMDEGRPYPVTWTLEELRVSLLEPTEYAAKEIWIVRNETQAVAGAMFLDVPLKDNTFALSARIGVRADARRQGYGSALAQAIEERAAYYGRTVVQAQVDIPLGNDTDTPAQAFARSFGLTPANFEVHRVLELPLAEDVLDKLSEEAAQHHEGYHLRSWQDHCPDDLVDAFAALQASFNLEAPHGELEVEAAVWDADRVRSVENQSLAQGRHGWMTVAIAPDGSLAGHTELYVGKHDPGNVFQWGTLVSPAHRGHRLGLALKAHNHRELQRSHPEPLVVHTWNGEANTAMNAVNAKLGFRPVELHEEWQRSG
ncbi:GNAT family N-acetyltransferase [Kribbella caucasensis]|uniref:GNAT family N-acetyltransferase n=1 Tax=Kribbella caucasensis TaxID=2512215 RepID=UPI00105BB803|nr:GNAT family N-acetyltransferase [Kribbella sp. VKM Ac-2527]